MPQGNYPQLQKWRILIPTFFISLFHFIYLWQTLNQFYTPIISKWGYRVRVWSSAINRILRASIKYSRNILFLKNVCGWLALFPPQNIHDEAVKDILKLVSAFFQSLQMSFMQDLTSDKESQLVFCLAQCCTSGNNYQKCLVIFSKRHLLLAQQIAHNQVMIKEYVTYVRTP